ncbi:MAG: sigma-54 dependent transcriptional regulator [Thermoanaerobaculia bacterium]
MALRLLIVEDRESLRRMLVRALSGEGYVVEAAADLAETRAAFASGQRIDLVLSDLMLPDGSGLDVLTLSRSQTPPPPVVVLTGFGSVSAAVAAMKLGAADFLEKPIDLDRLFRLVASLVEEERIAPVFQPAGAPAIVGAHPRLRYALRALERVAPTGSTVLLTGESGTGKELFARALHALSPRRAGPFVAVNCAAIPETLVEAELFGHEKGAFTGADRRRPGRFESAARGTLLLDEVGELPLGVQAKVLRVLDDGRFERVGGNETLTADVRLVAATNRDLGSMVAAGQFRADLLYRLEIFPIELPPLRERASDIPLVALHLAAEISARTKLPPFELAPDALAVLEAEPWPGNVRQLANVLERAAILSPGERLTAGQIRRLLGGKSSEQGDGSEVKSEATSAAEVERTRIRQALSESSGDKHLAASALGMSYRTLLRRIEEYDLKGFPRYRG